MLRLIPNSMFAATGDNGLVGQVLAAQRAVIAEADVLLSPPPSWVIFILTMGIVVLAVWLARGLLGQRGFGLKRTPARTNTLNPLHIFAIFILFTLIQIIAIRFQDASMRYTLLLSSQVVMAGGSIFVAAITFRGGIARGLGLSVRRWKSDTARGVIGYLAVFPICIILGWATLTLFPDLYKIHPILDDMDWNSFPARTIALVVSAVILAPIGEELFFRGLIQSMFRRYLKSGWIAIVISSIFFIVVHDAWSWPTLFALSIALGYNYERTGRLYPSILIHALFNGVSCVEFLTK